MPTVRATVRLHHDSGLPEDDSLNTWHFVTDPWTDPIRTAITDAITRFYGLDLPTTGYYVSSALSISDILSPVLSGTYRITINDVAAPGPPLYDADGFTLQPLAGTALPEEVAQVMSYHADLTGLSPEARRHQRGRVYLGPMRMEAYEQTTAGVRATAQTRDIIRGCARRFKDDSDTSALYTWAVWSPTLQNANAVLAGWVDDAPDTQRRRGPDALIRATWTETP